MDLGAALTCSRLDMAEPVQVEYGELAVRERVTFILTMTLDTVASDIHLEGGGGTG